MPLPKHYLLEFRNAVSVFTGLGIAGLVDRIVMRNARKLPCIPGSTVKGRWRFFAERFLQGLGSDATDGLWMHKDAQWCKDQTDPQNNCTICRLFGNPALPSILQIGQGELESAVADAFEQLLKAGRNPVVHPDTELRPGIALSRRRRTALGDHLFFDEALPPVTFKGPIDFTVDPTLAELHFLKISAELVDAIGARKDIGRGALVAGIRLSCDV